MAEEEHFTTDQLASWGLLDLARREACRDALMAEVAEPPEAVLAVLRQQARAQAPGDVPLPSDAQLGREWRWQQWCQLSFGAKVASRYLQRKHQLDQVVFWQLRLEPAEQPDRQAEELAVELYLRLKEGEISFAALAASSGAVQPPWRWRQAWLVLQVEQVINARLDGALTQQLLAELGDAHLQQELAQRSPG